LRGLHDDTLIRAPAAREEEQRSRYGESDTHFNKEWSSPGSGRAVVG
jgi:hypothetical protein